MHYVNAEEVMQLFRKYVEAYNGLISKEIAYEELENALESAEVERLEKVKKVFHSGDTHAHPLTAEQLSEPVTSYDNTSIYEEVIKSEKMD